MIRFYVRNSSKELFYIYIYNLKKKIANQTFRLL